MLESNPSADSGTKTEAGCRYGTPFHYPSLRIGTKAINSGGLGAGPQIDYPLKTRNSHKICQSKAWQISPKWLFYIKSREGSTLPDAYVY
jgi:hypothetical protein